MPKPKPKPKTTTDATGKLSPKLRMFLDGSTEVNAARAEHAGALCLDPDDYDDNEVARRRPAEWRKPPSKSASRQPTKGKVSVFVHLRDASDAERFPTKQAMRLVSHQGEVVTAEVPLAELEEFATAPGVAHVTPGEALARPNPRLSDVQQRRPSPAARPIPPGGHANGKGVLIGIIDVEGFDFAHPEFLTRQNGQSATRFFRIWDQGGSNRPSPKERGSSPYGYGSEIRAEDMNRAIKEAPKRKLPAWRLEPQSEMFSGSHGTHVAGIAAGASGFCPRAEIAAVLLSLPDDHWERRSTFYDSTRIAHAVDYLVSVAAELKLPISINISLGTNGHAHDASSALDRWVDHLLATPGRCVSVAAGNAGRTRITDDDDIGWAVGRIHSSGQIAARKLFNDIEWVVIGNGTVDVSENELEIWYSGQDRFEVSIRPPNSTTWHGPVGPSQFIEDRELDDHTFLSVYNELYHPANGANYISVYLSPNLAPDGKDGVIGVRAGTWTIRLTGVEVRDGRYHAWVERDDPRPQGRSAEKEEWALPSYFSDRSVVEESTVSSLACGHRVLSVANLDEALERINDSSSQGPTRDGRNKPDIAAPGTDIVAANGFRPDREKWVTMTGTSMASPYVAGVAGLMLSANRALTAAQIAGIMQSTAKPLPGSDFAWRNDAGFGVIDPAACVAAAERIGEREEVSS